MNNAQKYIENFYDKYKGRASLKVGIAANFNIVYPLVFENEKRIPVGLVGMAWEMGTKENLVRIFHISSFISIEGKGSFILSQLCQTANEYRVDLTLQAEPQFNGLDTISGTKLVSWYHQFGFTGSVIMVRYSENTL